MNGRVTDVTGFLLSTSHVRAHMHTCDVLIRMTRHICHNQGDAGNRKLLGPSRPPLRAGR